MPRNRKPLFEIDGAKHHAALADTEGGEEYEYDPTLKHRDCMRIGVRDMIGIFVCYICDSNKPRRCQGCERYSRLKINEDKYVNRVLDTFDLWTGKREPYESNDEERRSKGPHDSARCHGCLKGICNRSEGKKKKKSKKKKNRRQGQQ
ncbi:hypothetical protein FBU30_007869 [Linnemannia zychae]|nr:hypothetical protein FBU30_007869 [Linnemannia zychae]